MHQHIQVHDLVHIGQRQYLRPVDRPFYQIPYLDGRRGWGRAGLRVREITALKPGRQSFPESVFPCV